MTAFEAARLLVGVSNVFVTSGRTCYQPVTRGVYLSREKAGSRDLKQIMEALHECAHHYQHRRHPVLFAFRNIGPVRYWLEKDACTRAMSMAQMLDLGPAANIEVDRSYSSARLFTR